MVDAGFLVRGGTIEGPTAPSEACRRKAPERRGGWGLGGTP